MVPDHVLKSVENAAEPREEKIRQSLLETGDLGQGLRARSLRGGAATVISQGCMFFISLGSMAVLARLLDPADFGLVALTSTFLGFVTLFGDLGLSHATIQQQELTHEQASNLFWINLGISGVAALAAAAGAPLVAAFFRQPSLTGITAVAALGLFLGGAALQHKALLQRRLRFGTLATINVLAALCGSATAVAAGWAGVGYWAIVIGPIVAAGFSALLIWRCVGWRPGWPRRDAPVWSMLRFGGYLSAFAALNYFARNSDNILIGYWHWEHPEELGYYERAYALLLLPISQVNRPITAVALPMLGRLQSEPQRFARAYRQFLSLATSITFPGVALMGVMAPEIFSLAMGPKWSAAAAIFRVLALAAVIQAVINPLGVIMVGAGRADRMFWFGVINTPLTIVCFLLAVPYGAWGVAVAYGIYSWVIFLPSIWFACLETPVRVADVLGVCAPPAAVALVVAAALAGMRMAAGEALADWQLFGLATIVAGLISSALYFFAFTASNPWRLVRELASRSEPR